MAPSKKRETRENQFYDVGVQGRKTGITLEDRGVRDEHGLEPISGIFSSPEKSPPRRVSNRSGGTVTESESMELTSSSPRRQSSMGPRAQPDSVSSPSRSESHPVISRLLDFEQEESSLQETPALSGSGQRRGQRRSIYSIEPSPSRITNSAMMEETIQEEIYAAEDSPVLDHVGEESGLQDIGNDTVLAAESEDIAEAEEETDVEVAADEEAEVSMDVEEVETVPEPIKEPPKRGRKRRSDAVESAPAEKEAPEPKKRGRKPLQKKDKNATAPPAVPSRRSKRVSDITEQDTSTLQDASAGAEEEVEPTPVIPKPRGRPPKAAAPVEMPPPAKKQKRQAKEPEKENAQAVFKKPKAAPKPRKKAEDTNNGSPSEEESLESGKLVDVYGKPLSKADLDQMSTTTTGTRFGRGRHLSVFRELEPDSAATVGRTGRHRVKPINFWANEVVSYDPTGNMQAVVNRVYQEPPKVTRKTGRKGQKRSLSAVEEEEDEVEIQPWEEEGKGQFEGPYRGYDAANKISTDKLLKTSKHLLMPQL
ncbi:mitotic fidelity of chromosome transmission- protein [Didymosphaeria variabile]|uniref:Mitotic fidelity of chromosome transmission-protein n=1 Tax=Didymosphaeria variabile TaxID=1932322 RepID=A0A9W9C708_9PLEO|nr:mitotic fidelity of chromosome transmission- protein [Didymosphaeria variabile]KAJ4347818.1 mitotic fidelity of chromosome transmission- protein [Didymosphaeria variabile]